MAMRLRSSVTPEGDCQRGSKGGSYTGSWLRSSVAPEGDRQAARAVQPLGALGLRSLVAPEGDRQAALVGHRQLVDAIAILGRSGERPP